MTEYLVITHTQLKTGVTYTSTNQQPTIEAALEWIDLLRDNGFNIVGCALCELNCDTYEVRTILTWGE